MVKIIYYVIRYKKIFLLSLCLSLLASNEYFASQKYLVCEVKQQFGYEILFTVDFHKKIKKDGYFHKCWPDGYHQLRYLVYDNEFKNYICSVKTDNYCAYIFFRILEIILSECSGIYRRKRVNKHFGFFYGSEVGFFFNIPRLHFENKYFTVGLFDEVRFNLISALLYITKAMNFKNRHTYYTNQGSLSKFFWHIVYAIHCIPAINGFHIIHVNFLKIITLNFVNILKLIASIIISKTDCTSVMRQELNVFGEKKDNLENLESNVDDMGHTTEYVTLYSYNVFNPLINLKEKLDPLPKFFYKEGNPEPIVIDSDNFGQYEYGCKSGHYPPGHAIYEIVKEVKSTRRMNLITYILKYICSMLSPSISFDLTYVFEK